MSTAATPSLTPIAKDGVLYDIRKTDDKPPVTSQRNLRGMQQIPFSGLSTIPPADSPDFKQVGNDGRTSELQIGKIGEVLPKNSIVAP